MTQRKLRIFVYRSPEEDTGNQEPANVREPGPIRSWFFAPSGLVCAWVLAIGLLIPVAVLILATLRETYVILLSGFGLWLMLGLIVIHWWIPSANRKHTRTEGIAAAGWHIALTVTATGVVGWAVLFGDGYSPAFTLGDTRPVVAAGAVFTAVFGLGVLWARGHSGGRTVRYALIGGSMLLAWMSLWLVAVHSGLLPPFSST